MTSTTSTVPLIELNNSVQMPQVGFGTFQISEGDTQEAVEKALELGYRHIDTAAGYYNEAGVGAALRASGLPQEDVFVTTKLRNGDQGFDSARRAFEDSRKALGLDVVDLYLVHWPVPSQDRYVQTWKALEQLYAAGAVRAIGISNFLPEHIERLLAETDVVPVVNQIEVHPTFQQVSTQKATTHAGIKVESYSPLGQGEDLDADVVTSIADRLAVTAGQVVLRWHVQQGLIVIPKSKTPERIAANLDLFGFELTAEDMAAITGLDTEERLGADPATADFTQYRS